jgi:hypothetical protein
MRDGQLLEKQSIDKIRHIPTVAVQGRYDLVCMATTAWALKKAFPEVSSAPFSSLPPFSSLLGLLGNLSTDIRVRPCLFRQMELIIAPNSGHSAREPEIKQLLFEQAEKFKTL